MEELAGRDVVVTGGAGALGGALVAQLLAHGARVHVPTIDEAEAERFRFKSDPRVVVRPGVDVTDEDRVERFYATVPELWASIHLAGGFAAGGIVDTSARTARHMLSLNALSAFLCCREAVRRMRTGGSPDDPPRGGRIVNVAAKPALVPSGGAVAYAMSKAAVASLTLSLSEEVRSEGILVNAVVPSVMDTPANRASQPDADFESWPKVDDVAATILFLASPRNTATRGALIPVYGRT